MAVDAIDEEYRVQTREHATHASVPNMRSDLGSARLFALEQD